MAETQLNRIDLVLAMDVFGEAGELPDPLPTHCAQTVEIVNGLSIGPVDERSEIIDACDPRGISWHAPVRQWGSQYGIWCDAVNGSMNEFDADDRLGICIRLSRLIQATAIDFRFAGRLAYDANGNISEFAPARVPCHARVAYIADPTRNWLSDADVDALRKLLLAFDPSGLPARVTSALFYHEYLHRLYYVNTRWPMATTGLEALIHTDKYKSTAQFVQRILGVQQDLNLALATEDDLRDMYDLRSRLAHGKGLGELRENERRLYEGLELLLRTVVRYAIDDSSVAALFKDDDAIRARWPVS